MLRMCFYMKRQQFYASAEVSSGTCVVSIVGVCAPFLTLDKTSILSLSQSIPFFV